MPRQSSDSHHTNGEPDYYTQSRQSTQIYLKDVNIGAGTPKGLIDTGSAACTIKASQVLLKNLPLCAAPDALKSFGPDNFQVISPDTILVDITIDGVPVKNVTCQIVPDDVQPLDMLIGRTCTTAPGVEHRQVNGKLVFNREEDASFAEIEAQPSTSSFVRAFEDFEASARSGQYGQMKSDNQRYAFPVKNYSETSKKVKEDVVLVKVEISPVPILDGTVLRREVM